MRTQHVGAQHYKEPSNLYPAGTTCAIIWYLAADAIVELMHVACEALLLVLLAGLVDTAQDSRHAVLLYCAVACQDREVDVLLGEADVEREVAVRRLKAALLVHASCVANGLARLWQGKTIERMMRMR